MVPKNWP